MGGGQAGADSWGPSPPLEAVSLVQAPRRVCGKSGGLGAPHTLPLPLLRLTPIKRDPPVLSAQCAQMKMRTHSQGSFKDLREEREGGGGGGDGGLPGRGG